MGTFGDMNSDSLAARGLLVFLWVSFCCLGEVNGEGEEPVNGGLAYGHPAEVHMSPSILKGAVGFYEEAVKRGDLVGVVLLVARDGKVVCHEALGVSDLAQQRPMKRDTLFHLASNTKPVVAAGIAILVEQGKLKYSDLVREFIPSWDNYRAGFITVDQLLSHTSGFRIQSLFLPPAEANVDLQTAVARFGEVGARVTPGTSYSYSNPGYNTLGGLIEIRSGEILEPFLDRSIYEPLGMKDSYHFRAGHDLEGKRDRLGPVYYRRDGDGNWVAGQAVTLPFARASGGMVSTAWDYALFCQMILNGGVLNERRILREETVEHMLTAKTERPGGAYGYGWGLSDGVASHSGSDGTHAWIDRKRGIVGLVFSQNPKGCPPMARFRELVNLAIGP